MRPGALSSALFVVASVLIVWLSSSLLGIGLWSLLMLGVSVPVGAAPYHHAIFPVAKALAMIAGIISLLAVALLLLAATTGGSFRLPDDQTLLAALLVFYGIVGLAFSRSKVIRH